MKNCPYCAERIQDEAIYCRYCHKDISTNFFATPYIAPIPIKNNPFSYDYKLDAEKIIKNGRVDLQDVCTLAELAHESYGFPVNLLKKVSRLRDSFVNNKHLPILRSFIFYKNSRIDKEQYINFCIELYKRWEIVILAIHTELINKQFSIDWYTEITTEVTQELFLAFLNKATEIEVSHEKLDFEKLAEISYNRFEPLLMPLMMLAVEIAKLDAMEFSNPIYLDPVRGQAPFLLELKQLTVLYNR